MTFQPTCPPRSTWQKMMEEGFADFSVGDLSTHLDTCPTCQAAVEGLMGGQRSWLAIADELRQELPPASPICQRMLDELKDRDPPWTVPPDGFQLAPHDDADTSTGRVFCPHCLDLVQMVAGEGGERCPACGQAAATAPEKTHAGYQVNVREANPHKSEAIQEYVQSLEAQARNDEARVPNHRFRFPVDLIAGVILIVVGLVLFANAFSGEGNLLVTFVRTILPGFGLILVGAMCVIFWAK